MAAIHFITVVDIVLASAFFYILSAFRDHLKRRGIPYPPGPKPWPIIGNLLDSPKQSQWTAYTEMSKKYGWSTSLRASIPLTEAKFAFSR